MEKLKVVIGNGELKAFEALCADHELAHETIAADGNAFYAQVIDTPHARAILNTFGYSFDQKQSGIPIESNHFVGSSKIEVPSGYEIKGVDYRQTYPIGLYEGTAASILELQKQIEGITRALDSQLEWAKGLQARFLELETQVYKSAENVPSEGNA